MTVNFYDYVNAINTGKDIMTGTDNDELAEKGYNAFMVNRQFSYFPDTIFVANEMNANPQLEKKLCFSFYINIVRPKKRFARWAKTEHGDDLEAVSTYFGYSYEKANQIMDILSSQQIETIKKKLEKGGLKK